MWPDWAIYWTLGNFLEPMAAINLPKSPTYIGNFCKGVKIYHFLVKSFLGNFYIHLAIFSGHTGATNLFINTRGTGHKIDPAVKNPPPACYGWFTSVIFTKCRRLCMDLSLIWLVYKIVAIINISNSYQLRYHSQPCYIHHFRALGNPLET